jgi:uncharacterized membrane protein
MSLSCYGRDDGAGIHVSARRIRAALNFGEVRVAVDDNARDDESGFHLSLMQRLRAYLFAGILITAPISITVYLSWLVMHFVDERVNKLLPYDYNPNNYLPFSVPGLGLLIVLITLIFIGGLAAGLIGRAFVRISEGVLHRTPVVRSIYSAIKQIFHTILAERAQAFRQVVLVEFPRAGLWRIGFVTGVTPGKTQDVVPGGLVNVFIPGTPNPTAGFLVLVPKDEAIEIDLTPEEAVKLIVSGGIVTPPPRAAASPEEPPP